MYDGNVDGLIAWLIERRASMSLCFHSIGNVLIDFTGPNQALVKLIAPVIKRTLLAVIVLRRSRIVRAQMVRGRHSSLHAFAILIALNDGQTSGELPNGLWFGMRSWLETEMETRLLLATGIGPARPQRSRAGSG